MIRALLLAIALGMAASNSAQAAIAIVPVTSPGGISAWLSEEHTIPILTIEASFLGGPALDAAGHEGTTALMADLLDEGAGGLDAQGFATALEDVAAGIRFAASPDDIRVSATMLSGTRDRVTELLRLALTEPRFDAEAVERLRAQTLAGIAQRDAEPQAEANLVFFAQAFPDHPYGRPTEGTAASVAAITAEDLRAAHTAALTREHLRIAVVGDITPGELGPLLDRVFGALPATGPSLPLVALPQLSGKTTVIDADTPQSVVIFGNAGIPIGDPDFIPAMLVNTVLGGGSLATRLGEEMRVKRGLTYGVNTGLASGQFGALYLGAFSSSNAHIAEAIGILRAEWRRMAGEGLSDAELAAAKRYLTGEFPLRFDGSGDIAEQLINLQLAGVDPDYVNRRSGLIEAVTAAEAARVARRLVQPAALTLVIAGRPQGIAPASALSR